MSSDRDPWANASTFPELCELTALFVEGHISSPLHHGPLDEESEPLVPHLAAFNRAGFLTTHSQPQVECEIARQRASVDGIALEPIATRLGELAASSDLYVLVCPPRYSGGLETPITVEDGEVFTRAGWGCPARC